MLLTSHATYSAGNFFAFAMHDLPNVIVLGDTTGGGGGTVADVMLPNGWRLRYPTNKCYSATGANMEFGLPPDIFVTQRTVDFTTDEKDTTILRAIAILDSINHF